MHFKAILIPSLFLFSICSIGCSPASSKKKDSEEDEPINREKVEISYDELETIINKAVDEEKNNMSKCTVGDYMTITMYKDGYYYRHVDYSKTAPGSGIDSLDVYAYSTPNYTHNYYTLVTDNNFESITVNDYIDNSFQDQYVFGYGYAQYLLCPAAYMSCYSGIGPNKLSQNYIYREIYKQGNDFHFAVGFDLDEQQKWEYVFSINKKGQMTFLYNDHLYGEKPTRSNLDQMPEAGYVCEFNPRQEAPQKIKDIFKDYH